MILRLINITLFFSSAAVLFMVISCSEPQSESSTGEAKEPDNEVETLSTLLESTTSTFGNSDLESLLTESKSTFVQEVVGAEVDEIMPTSNSNNVIQASTLDIKEDSDKLEETIKDTMEAEKALQTLEVSALEHQRSIEELRKINAHKDKTIVSLSTINDELLTEIRRLKGSSKSEVAKIASFAASPNGKVFDLRSEIKNLKNSLLLKSSEIKDLRMRNDSLEVRITSLEKTPTSQIALAEPSFRTSSLTNNDIIDISSVDLDSKYDFSSLDFDAVVTSYTGKSKEAFYTEFFIVNDDLNSILSRGGLDLSNFSGLENYGELWARARKNSFLYPNVLKQIRSLLLEQVEFGNGKRIRTDINGAAKVENLSPGNYYLIGNASLGQVGVSWDVPVVLESGANRVSLTLANASWSK